MITQRRGRARLRTSITTGAVLVMLASVTVAAASVAPPDLDVACPDAGLPSFVDVSGTHARAIACIEQLGITQGTSDPQRYEPDRPVSREQMASFIDRLVTAVAGEPLPGGPSPFQDVSGTHAAAVNRLSNAGIAQGVEPGRFDPLSPVTRGQMALFIARALDILDDGELNGSAPPPAESGSGFPDLQSVHRDAVDRLAGVGVVQGFGDGTYRPGEHVTRAQMASFVARAAAVALGAEPGDPDDPDDPDDPGDPDDLDDPDGTGLRIDPREAALDPGEQHTVVTTVRDENDNPYIGADVLFEVYEVVGEDGDATYHLLDFTVVPTNVAGSASYTYSSDVPARDLIVACVVDDTVNGVCIPDPDLLNVGRADAVVAGQPTGFAEITWIGDGTVPGPEIGQLHPGPVLFTSYAASLTLGGVNLPFPGVVTIEGELSADGALTIPQGGFTMPAMTESLDLGGGASLALTIATLQRSAGTGTYDEETGHVELELDLGVEIRGQIAALGFEFGDDGECGIPAFGTVLTTGSSGIQHGSPVLVDGSLTLVDNQMIIEPISGCGTHPLLGDISAALNDQTGLTETSTPGQAALRFSLQYQAPAPQ